MSVPSIARFQALLDHDPARTVVNDLACLMAPSSSDIDHVRSAIAHASSGSSGVFKAMRLTTTGQDILTCAGQVASSATLDQMRNANLLKLAELLVSAVAHSSMAVDDPQVVNELLSIITLQQHVRVRDTCSKSCEQIVVKAQAQMLEYETRATTFVDAQVTLIVADHSVTPGNIESIGAGMTLAEELLVRVEKLQLVVRHHIHAGLRLSVQRLQSYFSVVQTVNSWPSTGLSPSDLSKFLSQFEVVSALDYVPASVIDHCVQPMRSAFLAVLNGDIKTFAERLALNNVATFEHAAAFTLDGAPTSDDVGALRLALASLPLSASSDAGNSLSPFSSCLMSLTSVEGMIHTSCPPALMLLCHLCDGLRHSATT